MSALITRASISSVTPGRVAIRAPASLARLRAAVWESDWIVGARTTSAAAIASATGPGGSAACDSRSCISATTASAPASARLRAHPLAQPERRGIADDQHLLALADAEAVVDDGAHRLFQVRHLAWTLVSTVPEQMTRMAGTRLGALAVAIALVPATALGAAVINGTPKEDKLEGTPASDTIDGLELNDTLWGFGSADILRGGPDNDFILGGKGDDALRGGPGVDVLRGGPEKDSLLGGKGGDENRGEAGEDTVDGGDLGRDIVLRRRQQGRALRRVRRRDGPAQRRPGLRHLLRAAGRTS